MFRPGRRLLLKTGDAAVCIDDDHAVLIDRIARYEADSRDCLRACVHGDDAIEPEIGQIVAANDDECLVTERSLERFERAGTAHQRFFVQILRRTPNAEPSPSVAIIASAR